MRERAVTNWLSVAMLTPRWGGSPGKVEATANVFIPISSLKSVKNGKPYSTKMDEIMYEKLGKPDHKNDHNRSIPLAQLAPLLAKSGLQFVSLQKEYRASDRPELNRHRALLRLDDGLADFGDTAAVVGALDLIIAVDTAVAHLVGAMGKPLWLLLPAVGDWR